MPICIAGREENRGKKGDVELTKGGRNNDQNRNKDKKKSNIMKTFEHSLGLSIYFKGLKRYLIHNSVGLKMRITHYRLNAFDFFYIDLLFVIHFFVFLPLVKLGSSLRKF